MHMPPNPKKVAYERSIREREALRKSQIESCYSRHVTAQERYLRYQEELRLVNHA